MLHRVHWINSKGNITTSDGRNVGDIFMFLNSLRSYAKLFNTKSIYVAWDKKILYPSTNFRTEAAGIEYKAGRDKEKAKEVFSNEEDLVKMLNCLGVKNMYPRIMEADDVIAWLCHNLNGPNVVVTVDGDMYQLINERTSYYHPFKKKVIDQNNFEEEVGVPQKSFLYYKAILGDSSDNIPGLYGYGKVKAKRLAESIYNKEAKGLTKEKLLTIRNNLKLMDLSLGYKLAGKEEVETYQSQFDELLDIEVDLDSFKSYCEEFEFKRFLDKFSAWEDVFKESRLFTLLNSMPSNNK